MAATSTMVVSQKQAQEEETELVVLRCFDGAELAVPAGLAVARSRLAADAAAAGERVVDVPGNISGVVVSAVVAYWHGRAAAPADYAAGRFDEQFVGGLSHDASIDLIHAAHHLADVELFNLFA